MYWINAQKCRACLSCADACQVPGAITVRNGRPVIDAAYCTDCGACVAACPHQAIEQVGAATPEIIRPAHETQTRPARAATAQPSAEPVVRASAETPANARPAAGVPAKTRPVDVPATARPREGDLPAEQKHSDRMDIIRTVAEIGGALIVGIIGALKDSGLGSGAGTGGSTRSGGMGSGLGRGGGSGRGAGRGRGGGGRRFRNRNR